MAPTPVFLSGESHGWRHLAATVHRVAKSQTWLKSLNTHTHTHTHTLGRLPPHSTLGLRVSVPGCTPPPAPEDSLLTCLRPDSPHWAFFHRRPLSEHTWSLLHMGPPSHVDNFLSPMSPRAPTPCENLLLTLVNSALLLWTLLRCGGLLGSTSLDPFWTELPGKGKTALSCGL